MAETAPVPAMLQHPGEFGALMEIYKKRRPKRVLEVGVFEGGTLYHWVFSAPKGATVVAVDILHRRGEQYEYWRDDVELVVIKGDSHDEAVVAQVAEHAPYEWIFIDADHYYDSVKRDWQLYSPMTAPGGIVALHDIASTIDPTIEVNQLWAELVAEHETSEITFLDGGFGIGLVEL